VEEAFLTLALGIKKRVDTEDGSTNGGGNPDDKIKVGSTPGGSEKPGCCSK